MTDREAITMLKGCSCTLVMRRAINKGISALQEREERSNGCEYCSDKVMVLRQISCEGCIDDQDGIMCGKLKRCSLDDNDRCYKCVVDDENNFCPMCGRKLKED